MNLFTKQKQTHRLRKQMEKGGGVNQEVGINIYIHTYIHKYIYIYNGILLSHKKEYNNAIGSNMCEPEDYQAK